MERKKQVEMGVSTRTVYLMPWSTENTWKPHQTNLGTAQMGFGGFERASEL